MMPGIQIEEIRDALLDAYDLDSLTEMLLFRLDKNIANVVNVNAPFKTVLFSLLRETEREGWSFNLVREAYRYRPRNEQLLVVYEKYGLAPRVHMGTGGRSAKSADQNLSGLQRTIRQENPNLDLGVWRFRLSEIEARICRVDINDGPIGTGFLVGPDLILTNYHVVERVLSKEYAESAVSCLFDFKQLNDGTKYQGKRVSLHSPKGILLHSPCTAEEKADGPLVTLPTFDELDFALLRLADPEGNNPSFGARNGARGWESLPNGPATYRPDQGIIIAQHPRGESMKLSIDTSSLLDTNSNLTRVRYRNNTEGGSSGSPVFDMSWTLVALHHYGDPAVNRAPKFNQGVASINRIRDKIRDAGIVIS